MKDQIEIRLDVEQLEDRIAPSSALGACLTTPNGTDTSVNDAALAANGNHGGVTVVEGVC